MRLADYARSLAVYRLTPGHQARLRRLYRAFVPQGGLVFDVGAHVGDRTAAFRALGARVVAVEPQPEAARLIRLLPPWRGVEVVEAAVGAAEGEAALRVNRRNPTVSTLSRAFIDAVADDPNWRGQRWDATRRVRVTTLDALIAAHGAPDFVKIDVEGHEAEALAGLTRPPPALSFEIVTAAREAGRAALARAAALGYARFRLALGESGRFETGWLDAGAMADALDALPDAANSGDVYGRLRTD